MTQQEKRRLFEIACTRERCAERARSDYGWGSDRALFASAAYDGCAEIIRELGLEQEYGQWKRNREVYQI